MEPTPLQLLEDHKRKKLPSGTYTMEVTSWNLLHGIYLSDFTLQKLPHVNYTMEVTWWK